MSSTPSTPGPPPTPAAPPPTQSLGQRTVHGAIWLTAQFALQKLLSAGVQILLARLLTDNDFGVVALAYAIASFTTAVVSSGIDTFLIQRHQRVSGWIAPAFWLSAFAGALASIITVGVLFLPLHFLDAPHLKGLLIVLAATMPINALSTVPTALLNSRMKYSYLAKLALAMGLANAGGSALLAILGFGPYSFVVPGFIVAIVNTSLVWLKVRPNIRGKPRMRRWIIICRSTGVIFLGRVLQIVVVQGDYMLCGLLLSVQETGMYYFAFVFAAQAVVLGLGHVSNILLSALAKLADQPAQQARAALRAMKMASVVFGGLCFLQAATAQPIVRLIYGSKWDLAVTLSQAISLGLAVSLNTYLGVSALNAAGRFTAVLWLRFVCAVSFLVCVIVGAFLAGAMGVALGVGLFYILTSYLWVEVFFHGSDVTRRERLRMYVYPSIAGCASFGLSWAGLRWLGVSDRQYAVNILVPMVVGVPLYGLALRVLMPETVAELVGVARRVLDALFRRLNLSPRPGMVKQP